MRFGGDAVVQAGGRGLACVLVACAVPQRVTRVGASTTTVAGAEVVVVADYDGAGVVTKGSRRVIDTIPVGERVLFDSIEGIIVPSRGAVRFEVHARYHSVKVSVLVETVDAT